MKFPELPYLTGFPSPFTVEEWTGLDFLQKNFNKYVDKHYSQFEWFRDKLSPIETILNPGCSYGWETFTLTWHFKAHHATGLDIDPTRIKHTIRIKEIISDFCRDELPDRIATAHPQHKAQLQTWYEEIPNEVKKGVLPKFLEQDFSSYTPTNDFDLVYCRYFLWGIAKKNPNNLYPVCQNIANAVKPDKGRVVIVEPAKIDNNSYDFGEYFEQAGLKLLYTERDEECFRRQELQRQEQGKFDTHLADPKGYILQQIGA